MAIFQDRFKESVCKKYNNRTKQFIKDRGDEIKCYDPHSTQKTNYGNGGEGFEYIRLQGVNLRVFERTYSTDDGYYFFADSSNLKLAKEKLL